MVISSIVFLVMYWFDDKFCCLDMFLLGMDSDYYLVGNFVYM